MADIVTLDEVKKQLNIPLDDTSQDDELLVYIGAVTEVVEDIVGPVTPRAVVETHDGGRNAIILRKPPILSVTSVVEDGTTLTTADYTASLDAGILYRGTGFWLGGRGSVTVTYQAGRQTTPVAVRLAAQELTQVNFRPQLGGDYSPFDTDAPEEGIPGEVRLGFFVPNRIRELLKPYQQGGWLP
ncbi:phage head-tail connector protein [Micromonospora sp. URMC 103]|uniref:phage head-tail connector protein n=1 Tax=Micromonospora sp. URMC 103 TaxID=3423406 RepID=UPI003F1938C6